MTTSQFHVPDISCDHCVRAITNEVKEVHGVTAVKVDIPTKLVTVEHNNAPQPTLVAAINEAGFDTVEPVA